MTWFPAVAYTAGAGPGCWPPGSLVGSQSLIVLFHSLLETQRGSMLQGHAGELILTSGHSAGLLLLSCAVGPCSVKQRGHPSPPWGLAKKDCEGSDSNLRSN